MVSRITPRQVVARMSRREPVAFVDARREGSWDESAEQVSGAVRVRLSTVVKDATRVSRGCPVVVYGADDHDTDVARVADELRMLGFAQVKILAGGFAAWREQHGPLQEKRS
jgi:3-mercaptopyruvate sulfurtransferase SseA